MSGLNNKRNIDNQLNQFMNTNIEKENLNEKKISLSQQKHISNNIIQRAQYFGYRNNRNMPLIDQSINSNYNS